MKKDQNPAGNQVSKQKSAPCFEALAPNSGYFRDPLANRRGRKPANHPWRGDPKRWLTKGPYLVLERNLAAVLHETGLEGWEYEIIGCRQDFFNPRGEGNGEVLVVFKKQFFKKEPKP